MTNKNALDAATTRNAMAIIGILFFIFGFVTWLNGPLISFVKLRFGLNDFNAFLVPSVFYVSYFFLSLPASFILKRIGMKKGISFGLLLMSVGAAVFGQYTHSGFYGGTLSGLFIIGAGLSILQIASNPYISILGPIESAASRIAFMGICNKVAGIIAPVAFGYFVLQGIDKIEAMINAAPDPAAKAALLNQVADKVYVPDFVMAGLLALLAYWINSSSLPDIGDEANEQSDQAGDKKSIFQYPQLWMGAFAIFCYVGVEVLAGDAIGTYGKGFNIPSDQAKYFTAFTLAAMLIGYVLGLFLIPKYISQEKYLAFSAILGVILSILAFSTKGYVSVAMVAALGFANAMMWPAIFPLGIKNLGKFTETGSAIMIMGIVGGSVFSQIFAHLKDVIGFQTVFIALTVPAYIYILIFANTSGNAEKKANSN